MWAHSSGGCWCPECDDDRTFCEYCAEVLTEENSGQHPNLLGEEPSGECDFCALGECPVCGEYAVAGELIPTPDGYVCDEECLLEAFPLIYLARKSA